MDTHDERVSGLSQRSTGEFFYPETIQDKENVRKELREVLAGAPFRNSKRYAAVLTFIVDQTLEGNGDRLKERTIGIEVFHRAPDYDTATDHAVRSAVAEVRKRLGQHYQHESESALRIEVLPGSYVPQFRRPAKFSLSAIAAADSNSIRIPVTDRSTEDAARRPRPLLWFQPRGRITALVAIFSLTALLAGAVRVAVIQSHNTLNSFWRPIFSSHSRVLLCIGDMEGGLGSSEAHANLNPALTLSDFQNSPFETASVYDAMTMAKFAGFLEAHGRQFRLKSQSDATYTDLQNGPAILVGLLNNSWTERLVPNLRFTVENDSGKVIIRDRINASRKDWSVDYTAPYLDVSKDYALVLRMIDPKTEQMVIVAAGITVFGTSAAGDFLTNRDEIKKLSAIAPPGWEKKNMEIVLSTDVIRGRSGPADIVAAQFW